MKRIVFLLICGIHLNAQNQTSTFDNYANAAVEPTLACGYVFTQSGLPSGGQAFSSAAAAGSFGVTTSSDCAWSVSGMPPWITSASGGTGDGTVDFQVQANAGAERKGSITVGGQTFVVEQANGSLTNLSTTGRFAHVTSGGTWKFTLVEVNLGVAAGVGRLTFNTEAGGPLQMPLTFPQSNGLGAASSGPLFAATLDRRLNPYEHVILESTGPDNMAPLIGSGTVNTSAGDRIRAFGIFSNPTYHWDAVVPPETRNSASYFLAFDNTGALATGVAVNAFDQAQAIGVVIRDATGAQIGTDSINLPQNGHISFMLFERYPITAGKRGTVEFIRGASGQITVLGLRANGGALTSLPVLAGAGTGGTLPHVTYNGGFTSVIYLVNTGISPGSFTLSLFGDAGTPLAVPLSLPQSGTTTTTSQLTRDLAPGAMLIVETQAQDALASVAGSAQLTTSGSINAFEIFRWTTFGQEASVPLVSTSPVAYALVFDNTGGLTTGVALANPSSSEYNIIVIIRDELGVELVRDTVNLKPRGHTQFMLPAKYAIAAGKRGVVVFTLSHFGGFSAVGLRAKADGTLTTIPVLAGQPLPLNLQ